MKCALKSVFVKCIFVFAVFCLIGIGTAQLVLRHPKITIGILAVSHILNLVVFWCCGSKLKKHLTWHLWWKPYFNHRFPRRVLKHKFGTEQIKPNIIERLFLPLLVRIPYVDLFNNPIIRLPAIPMLLLFEYPKKLEYTNYYQVDLRVLLMPLIAFALHFPLRSHWVGSPAVLLFIVAWRVLCMISYNAGTVFFQYSGIYRQPISMVRSLIILFFGYLELVLWFSLLYISWGCIQSANCENILKSPVDSIYFSMVTITTLGYGDFRPATGMGRVFVFFEVLIGVVYVLLVIADYIQRTSSRRSSR